jgi:hypothetical protein
VCDKAVSSAPDRRAPAACAERERIIKSGFTMPYDSVDHPERITAALLGQRGGSAHFSVAPDAAHVSMRRGSLATTPEGCL